MEKYKNPFPARQLTGNDFKELVDYLNSVIDESNLTNEKLIGKLALVFLMPNL